MDVSNVASLSSAMTQMQTSEAAGMMVLKKAIDLQAQSAAQLLQAVPQMPSNPAHLGNAVDIKV